MKPWDLLCARPCGGVRVVLYHERLVAELQDARTNVDVALAERERIIQKAIGAGLSERRIGDAVGLSGVSIHNRKGGSA